MKMIGSKDLGPFEFQRFEFESKWLGRKETTSIIRPKGKARPKATIHYFHAGFTDDRMLLETQLVERLDPETADFLVSNGVQFAAGNYGLSFLLTAKDDPKRPFSDYFFDEILPLTEEGTDTKPETRFLAGASLGGHSSLVAFARKPELFKGVASTIGALMNFDFWDDAAFERYAKETGINSEFKENLKAIFRGFFQDYTTYRQADPMLMMKAVNPKVFDGKKILVETGSADDFGFHAGMSEFAALLKQLGIQHRFEFIEGGRHEPVFVMSRFAIMLRYLLSN